ncbi:MAG TPA: zeta toxin family protein [Rhabdochlamydiaceae bacterium]|nr:zeta toxin family protein [Rhabdochlamydiaceae bacterium]
MKKILITIFAFILPIFANQNYLFFTESMMASHLKDYNCEEKEAIEKDLNLVRDICFSGSASVEKPVYLATAGGPGARKSTIMARFLKTHPEFSNIVHLDIDQRGLRFMAHTYYARSLSLLPLAEDSNYLLSQKKAYEKWRGGSNYITLKLLEEAFAQRKNIAHAVTSTGEHTPELLSKIKEAGYEIAFLLCSAEDEFRQQALQYRMCEQKFYQATPEDAVNKGKFFPMRMPAYFASADALYLFWSDDLATPERLAAVLKNGQMEVMDQDALGHFIDKFERDRALLKEYGSEIPEWNNLLKLYYSRF